MPDLELEPNPDGDDKATVPRAALEAERQKRQDAETEAAELRGRVGGLETAGARPEPEKNAPKEFTRAELRTAVADEKITQDEADDIFERQTEKRITANATAAATNAVSSTNLGTKIETQITQYRAAVPDLSDKKSAAFAKVQKEFDALADLGYDRKDLRTEVAALRGAFGDIDVLTKATEGERKTFKETGGRDTETVETGAWPKGMTADQRAYYESQIASGVLEDKAAALEEFNYKPKHRPARGRAA